MKKVFLMLTCCFGLAAANAQIATFNYTGTIATWTVPCGVTQVTITATGATGGVISTYTVVGGKGAQMIGTFTVVPASSLNILVGGVGGNGTGGGGGGGGTFVTTSTNSPLIIAGGGGGTCPNSNAYVNVGIDAVTTTSGVNGYSALGGVPANYGVGGVGGNGATNNGGSGPCGGNGGGLLTNGTNYSCCVNTWGYGFVNGGTGGLSGCGEGGVGGFGGGGGGGYYGGGGGGGYSGGGGAWNIPTNGGGGGSYNIGSNQTNTAAFNAGGNGQVVITWVASSPVVTATVVSSVSCNGGSNGSTHGTVTGGGAPYTYVWTPSAQTNATATGLTAGTYTISVSDACGHTASSSVAITQPAVLAATATTTSNVHCNGGSTGATGATVTGGTTPYTYAWTGGSTNATATGLTAGSYTLSVTDKNGCSATASTVVTQPNALSDSAFTINNVLCNGGSTGSASNIAKGGSSPYTYLWTPGGATKDTASGLSAGTYTLMVSDACGASATTSASITQPTAISITSHSAPDNGHGVGTAVVSVSGGVGPYTYLWTGGKTTDSIGGLTKGTYCVDVRDANGCKDSICVVVKTTAGIDGITDNATQIVVYPNPNNGQFTIESSIGGASTVEIYNILGEKVFTRSLSTTKGTNTISVNQPNGVYLYRIISDSGNLLGEGRISIQK